MNYKLTVILLLCFSLTCKDSQEQSKDKPDSSATMKSASAVADERSELEERSEEAKKAMAPEEKPLGDPFLPNLNVTDRLLEYNVNLTYQCHDLVLTRKELLKIITKYGYLENSNAYNDKNPYMNLTIKVNATKLHEILLDLDQLGSLQNEEISVVDHTDAMVWQKRKVSREKVRLIRRAKALNQTNSNQRNWPEIEESIEQSEENLDLSEHETWRILEKVKWATIQLHFVSPRNVDEIEVPIYKNALIGILNFTLSLLYYVIWILPFIGFLFLSYLAYGRFKKIRKSS